MAWVLWIKSLHLFFVVSWFAGLFYLPRIFVNLAMETDATSTERLILMARKLYRFMALLAVPAVLSGLWLWWVGFGVAQGPGGGWIYAKSALVILLIGYHLACGSLLKKFENARNARSHIWFRWFNEGPTIILLAIMVLAVVKPF